MKVEILRPVMISGEPAKAGSILEVSHSDAVTLIGLGKAVEHKAEAEAPASEPAPKKTTTRKRTKES
tara:strand:+ start:361 stop:561 length:201 start_codon:yes stop_codon:yes gene_type:complete